MTAQPLPMTALTDAEMQMVDTLIFHLRHLRPVEAALLTRHHVHQSETISTLTRELTEARRWAANWHDKSDGQQCIIDDLERLRQQHMAENAALREAAGEAATTLFNLVQYKRPLTDGEQATCHAVRLRLDAALRAPSSKQPHGEENGLD